MKITYIKIYIKNKLKERENWIFGILEKALLILTNLAFTKVNIYWVLNVLNTFYIKIHDDYILLMEKLKHRVCPWMMVKYLTQGSDPGLYEQRNWATLADVVYRPKSWVSSRDQISFFIFFILQSPWLLLCLHKLCLWKIELILLKKPTVNKVNAL